ncbi:MAG: hypothetical protein IM557_11220 [Chitinophagaceae bacterium]|nr:hypothetical protein [Chitinophagaceae bacterium]
MTTLEKLYLLAKKGDQFKLYVPGSYVIYTRWAIYEKTGIWLEPEQVEQYLYEEGLLPKHEVRSVKKALIERRQIKDGQDI